MIKEKNDLIYYLEEDRKSLSRKPRTFKSRIIDFFKTDEIWKYQRLLRYLEYYTNIEKKGLLSIYYKFLMLYYHYRWKQQSIKLGFSIPINVFGPGLSIPHYGTIVVNPGCKIGANCRLHTSVNIGASAGKPGAPIIGNNVYIGPGAIIFGNIIIGNNNTIGANSTVNKSFVEDNIVLAGSPAKIVKQNYPNWLEFNRINN